MYARVTTVQTQVGKIDEAFALWNESLLPRYKQHRGFKGAHIVANRDANKAIVIAYWDAPTDAQAASDDADIRAALAAFPPLFSAPAVTEDYEVLDNEP